MAKVRPIIGTQTMDHLYHIGNTKKRHFEQKFPYDVGYLFACGTTKLVLDYFMINTTKWKKMPKSPQKRPGEIKRSDNSNEIKPDRVNQNNTSINPNLTKRTGYLKFHNYVKGSHKKKAY